MDTLQSNGLNPENCIVGSVDKIIIDFLLKRKAKNPTTYMHGVSHISNLVLCNLTKQNLFAFLNPFSFKNRNSDLNFGKSKTFINY